MLLLLLRPHGCTKAKAKHNGSGKTNNVAIMHERSDRQRERKVGVLLAFLGRSLFETLEHGSNVRCPFVCWTDGYTTTG